MSTIETVTDPEIAAIEPKVVKDDVEAVARAISDANWRADCTSEFLDAQFNDPDLHELYLKQATAAIQTLNARRDAEIGRTVPIVPTEAMWGGLARAIMMWLDMAHRTPRNLFQHLERSGHEIPQWLRDEPELKNLDHVPSKGTRCAIIYRAMIEAAP